jgi:hypothetical protein
MWVCFEVTLLWMVGILLFALGANIWLLPNSEFLTVLAELFAAFLPAVGAMLLVFRAMGRSRKRLAKLPPGELLKQKGAALIPYSEVTGARFTPHHRMVEVIVDTKRGSLAMRIETKDLEPFRGYLQGKIVPTG